MAGHCRRPDQGRSLLHCQGLSELVRDTAASFYEGLEKDNIQVLDPARYGSRTSGCDLREDMAVAPVRRGAAAS